jgi:transcriptional regulator with XRE-family HTH domain
MTDGEPSTGGARDAAGQTFADWLREKMAERGLSHRVMARSFAVSTTAVNNWLNGGSYPARSYRKLLAAGFDIPESEIPGRHGGAASGEPISDL